jgi:hypothetical protein
MVDRTVVTVKALLRGEERERHCYVSVVKVPDPTRHPYAAPIKILQPDDGFPDGNYEVVLEDDQTFRIFKRDGEYRSTP